MALLHTLSLPTAHFTHPNATPAQAPNRPTQQIPSLVATRRKCLFALTALTATPQLPSKAEDIPLFGLRKKLRKVEEEAEKVLREGEKAVERGLEKAEKTVLTAEKEIETVEREIGTVGGGFAVAGDLAQAGIVAVAEFLGVLIATAVVNGILGPEAQKS
ncbi:hypothetical protein ACLOJK_011228 [Asimina triloba]